ncbi:MAG: FkbM family methyltransferase [Bacteroidota bacterium]
MLKPHYNVLDVGANIGIMTSLLAKHCREGSIYAIEPIPNNIQALNRMIRFHKLNNVSVIPSAVGNEMGELEMRMPIIRGVRMQGLSHVHHPQIEGYEHPYQSFHVSQRTLDALFPHAEIHAMKMDVENFEFNVLIGASQLLKRCKPLLYMELWDNENRRACMEFLKELGYKPFVYQNRGLVPYENGKHTQHNFFFSHYK